MIKVVEFIGGSLIILGFCTMFAYTLVEFMLLGT